MSRITTHILDTSIGRPAAGVNVILQMSVGEGWEALAVGRSDMDGRVRNLLPDERKVAYGVYRLLFDTQSYFELNNVESFYPSVTIEFTISDDSHYHVPLLLNPFGYSTYRGS